MEIKKSPIKLIPKEQKSNLWSTVEALESVISDIKSGDLDPDRALLILVEKKEGKEQASYIVVNETVSTSQYDLMRAVHEMLHRSMR